MDWDQPETLHQHHFYIAFGIAVDDTIHFISKLRIELAKGKDLMEAVSSIFSMLERPSSSPASSFAAVHDVVPEQLLGTFYIGALISTTLLLAVVSDLFVLPWLVMKLLRWNAPKRPSILTKFCDLRCMASSRRKFIKEATAVARRPRNWKLVEQGVVSPSLSKPLEGAASRHGFDVETRHVGQ